MRYYLGSLIVIAFVLGLWVLADAASITLVWNYSQGAIPAATFRVYKQPACTGPFTVVQTQAVDLLTWRDTQVVVGNTYCWYVTAVAATGEESTPSNVLMFPGPDDPLPAPRNLSVVQ